jgi:hypothetical protein
MKHKRKWEGDADVEKENSLGKWKGKFELELGDGRGKDNGIRKFKIKSIIIFSRIL